MSKILHAVVAVCAVCAAIHWHAASAAYGGVVTLIDVQVVSSI